MKDGYGMGACHKAFQTYIEKSYTALDVFTEYTLDRDEGGNYLNMSVSMDWVIWFNAWRSAVDEVVG